MQWFVGITSMNKENKPQVWYTKDIRQWMIWHWGYYSLALLLPVIIGITVGLCFHDNSIIAPLFIVPWVMLCQVINYFINCLIQMMTNNFYKKSKIITSAIFLYLFKYLFFTLPILIVALVNYLYLEVFNIYMTIVLYIFICLLNILIEFGHNYFVNKKSKSSDKKH